MKQPTQHEAEVCNQAGEMPKITRWPTPYLLAVILLFFSPSFSPQTQAQELPAQDVVVLIDCSESMSPYLRSVGGIVSRFVDGARAGDSIACYRFSNYPVLIGSRNIRKQADKALLKSQVSQLVVAGNLTNYTPALEKGLSEIRGLSLKWPKNDRLLVLITDGRRNPSDPRTESGPLGELSRKFSNLKAGSNFAFQCFYIGTWPEGDLQSYLLSSHAHIAYWPADATWLNALTLADVRIMETEKVFGQIPNEPTQSTFSVSFYPRRPPKGLAMIEIGVQADFTKGTLDRFFDIQQRRFICQEQPWTERFNFETRGFGRGDYKGSLVFQPSDPQTVLLSPRLVSFSFSVAESLRVLTPLSLRFGPTGYRGEYAETLSISIVPGAIGFPDNPDAISVRADIDLPEGLQIDISPALKDKEIVVNITASRHQPLGRNTTGTYEGTIKLIPKEGWLLTETEIPLSVEVAQKGVNLKAVAFYLIIVAGGIAAVAVLLLATGGVRSAISDYLEHRTRPVGKLILMRDPTKGIVKNINLGRIAEAKRTKEVRVGTGERVESSFAKRVIKTDSLEVLIGYGEGIDVELPHSSLIDRLFRFSGLRAPDDVHTIVKVVTGPDEVIVNNQHRSGSVQLRHLDILKLGAFEFIYEAPRLLQQVVLYFLSGEVRQGWIIAWNVEAEGFHLLDRGKLPSRESFYVRFHELKAVAFVRDFDGELTKHLLSLRMPNSGHLVRLIFADQEEMTGYVFDAKNVSDKFYFFPDAMGPNVLFFVIEKHTLKEMKLLSEDHKGARLARQAFRPSLEGIRRLVKGETR